MTQTRLESFIESLVNVLIGYGVAVASQIVLFPMFDVHVSMSTNFILGLWFTLISIVRSYAIRRFFNARLHTFSHKAASWIGKDPT